MEETTLRHFNEQLTEDDIRAAVQPITPGEVWELEIGKFKVVTAGKRYVKLRRLTNGIGQKA